MLQRQVPRWPRQCSPYSSHSCSSWTRCKTEILHVQFLDRLSTYPVQRQAPMVQTIPKTVQGPPLQSNKVIEIPVVAQRQIPMGQTCQKTIEIPPTALHATSPVAEYISPASVGFQATAPLVEYISLAPAIFQAPAPYAEYISPTQAVFQVPVPLKEYTSPVIVTAVAS